MNKNLQMKCLKVKNKELLKDSPTVQCSGREMVETKSKLENIVTNIKEKT